MSYDKLKDEKLDKLLQSYFGAEFFNPKHSEVRSFFKKFKTQFKNSKCKVITVAGTNGKGQTAHFINDYLSSLGYKCGLWTSPHVLSVTERFKFCNDYISHDELEEEFTDLYSSDLKLSYYEFLLYCFCSLSSKRDLDYIVLEVGLGGRLDAVNFLDADYTLLTSISKDHEEFLGSSLSGILKEKLGVCRDGAPHISSLEQDYLRKKQDHFIASVVDKTDLFEAGILKQSDDYFLRNKVLALYFINKLLNKTSNREELLSEASKFVCSVTKGRQEEVTIENIKFIFIGAHNIDGIRKMRDYFLANKTADKSSILCAFSKRSDEDIISSLEILKSSPCLWDSLNVTSFEHLKALPLSSLPLTDGVAVVEDWQKFLDKVINSNKGQWIVTGSYYFIGEVQKYLNSRFSIL
ncbi:hypothetical protein [Halobacteriovorax sp.]|uniref:hypothetical protein n=1 Tax=Halobacteriovorax sp. TaxID=2020862 RepID=UPI00356147C9